MLYSKIIAATVLVLLSLSTVKAKRVLKGSPAPDSGFQTRVPKAQPDAAVKPKDKAPKDALIPDSVVLASDGEDRGSPDDYPDYSNSTLFDEAGAPEALCTDCNGCSGCGDGYCVYYKDGNYRSVLDNRGKQGVFYTRRQFSCSFVNTYFSGYVCPCRSVCGRYNNVGSFLDEYCGSFVYGDSGRSKDACKDYLWRCCAYPFKC